VRKGRRENERTNLFFRNWMRTSKILSGVSSLTFGLALLFAYRADAAVFVATDTNDTIAPNSLRGAIIASNHGAAHHNTERNAEHNTILLQPKTYHLSIKGADENAALAGDLDITGGDLTIMVTNGNATIDATGLEDRVFHVLLAGRLSLNNIIVTGGASLAGVNGGGNGEGGGCIYNDGTLTLNHCIISNNFCGAGGLGTYFSGNGGNGGSGAGIYNAGMLMMDDCIIANNLCGLGGNSGYAYGNGGNGGNGSIYNTRNMRIDNCIFKDNSCGVGGTGSINGGPSGIGGGGGGLYNAGTVVMDNCTISNNFCGNGGPGYRYNNGADGGHGGGINNTRNLIVSRSIIYGNFSGNGGDGSGEGGTGGNGGNAGGIYNTGISTLTECSVMYSFSGNAGNGNISANGGNGGGIWNSGTITLYRSAIACNAAGIGADAALVSLSSGSGGNGGGVCNAGNLVLSVCSISENLAGQGGNGAPGYADFGDQGTAGSGGLGGSGGGIYNERFLRVEACTICANFAGTGGAGGNGGGLNYAGSGGLGGSGGGIFNYNPQLMAFLKNTLVALNSPGLGGLGGAGVGGAPDGNVGVSGSSPDLSGKFVSQGFNLISAVDGGIGFRNGVLSDQVGSFASPINPIIGPLQMNGGSTPTHALMRGSPAIDQGNSFGIHTDQRGHRRPYDYSSIHNAPNGDGSDIGAFELDTH
jgi:hypothetical protein